MTYKYPLNCNTPAEKIEYWYRAEELLRLEHNEMGKKFREGKIFQAEWDRYQKEDFEPRNIKIHQGINENRELLKQSTKWEIDIKKI